MKEGWRAVGGERKEGVGRKLALYGYHLTAFVHSIFFQHNFLHSSMNIANCATQRNLYNTTNHTCSGQLNDMMDP